MGLRHEGKSKEFVRPRGVIVGTRVEGREEQFTTTRVVLAWVFLRNVSDLDDRRLAYDTLDLHH